MIYFITSRYPTLSEYCVGKLSVIYLQPQFTFLHGFITIVLIIWLQTIHWLSQLQTNCRHIGVTSGDPVICEDLQLSDHISSPVFFTCANPKRMSNTTRKVIICSPPLWKGQKSWALGRYWLDTRKKVLKQMVWGRWRVSAVEDKVLCFSIRDDFWSYSGDMIWTGWFL